MLNVGDRINAAYTLQVIARLHAAYARHFCDHLRSTEDICRINCVHRTDVVRLVAISGISVVNWSHKCDQKYSSYEFSAFTCDNLSQPSVTYRNPSVTNPLATISNIRANVCESVCKRQLGTLSDCKLMLVTVFAKISNYLPILCHCL